MRDIVTDEVRDALSSEDSYQRSLWGKYSPSGREHDDRSLDEWILYINEYAAKARAETTSGDEAAAIHTIRKIVTMGVHCMRRHGSPQRPGHEVTLG